MEDAKEKARIRHKEANRTFDFNFDVNVINDQTNCEPQPNFDVNVINDQTNCEPQPLVKNEYPRMSSHDIKSKKVDNQIVVKRDRKKIGVSSLANSRSTSRKSTKVPLLPIMNKIAWNKNFGRSNESENNRYLLSNSLDLGHPSKNVIEDKVAGHQRLDCLKESDNNNRNRPAITSLHISREHSHRNNNF